MLVLGREIGEKIVIPEYGIVIEIVDIDRGRIAIGITAPREVQVHREEVWHRIEQERLERESRS